MENNRLDEDFKIQSVNDLFIKAVTDNEKYYPNIYHTEERMVDFYNDLSYNTKFANDLITNTPNLTTSQKNMLYEGVCCGGGKIEEVTFQTVRFDKLPAPSLDDLNWVKSYDENIKKYKNMEKFSRRVQNRNKNRR